MKRVIKKKELENREMYAFHLRASKPGVGELPQARSTL